MVFVWFRGFPQHLFGIVIGFFLQTDTCWSMILIGLIGPAFSDPMTLETTTQEPIYDPLTFMFWVCADLELVGMIPPPGIAHH